VVLKPSLLAGLGERPTVFPHLLAGEGTQDSLRQQPPRRSVGMGFLGGQAAAINMPQRGYLRAGSRGLAP
jgi:hypothetical protein